ncbi:GNAT family N-acetyltransferase [Pseudodonghicola flavimaris]|uniref:GNAT family N-acetyltransferase n=1 Tax=Pseudodonghicola flavimaris TaxID=3050036 RepID=A0ABT7F6P8_9RHOB|nr:GNAT family N-acetyltransferase [Pseudodonghicola flavimaris]MDK3020271.1 GNAT family N-acetyltransferase [Pseudodonghicola flavimaris]
MTPMSLPIPVIETDRLVLRGPVESDFDAHAALMASERSRFIGGPQDRAIAWRGFSGSIGHWVLRGYGMWVIADKADDTPLGRVGFINADGWDEPELGWHLYESAEGQGVAHEAALAARAYGAAQFGLDGVISYIDPANLRSQALAARLGAEIERDGEVMGHACQVWRHPKQEAL